MDIFSKHLEPLFFNFLKDKAYAIRDLGVLKIKVIFIILQKFLILFFNNDRI